MQWVLPSPADLINFVAAGEASKSMTVFTQLLDDILAIGVDRSTLLLAFGGGMIGDLLGFAGILVARRRFVQIPTSPAQVDSSVGGKTGVNAKAGKNRLALFISRLQCLLITARWQHYQPANCALAMLK